VEQDLDLTLSPKIHDSGGSVSRLNVPFTLPSLLKQKCMQTLLTAVGMIVSGALMYPGLRVADTR
jgi:hypothetical protein